MALLAIAQYGVPKDCEETAEKAVKYLLSNPGYNKVYETALLAMALQALDSNEHKNVISKCAAFLGKTQLPHGMWTYNAVSEEKIQEMQEVFSSQQEGIERPGNSTNNNPKTKPILPGDNSNTQFALLGLRAARWAGVKVDMRVVRNCQEHFMRTQNEDGGWGYTQYSDISCGSMTCAGIGSLCILDDIFKSGSYFKRRKIRKNNVAKGVQWMRDNFSVKANPGGKTNYLYYMYSMERAGALSGHTHFGEHNWYSEGWPAVCAAQMENGSWKGPAAGRSNVISETAFAILFLKKGARFHNPPAKIPISSE